MRIPPHDKQLPVLDSITAPHVRKLCGKICRVVVATIHSRDEGQSMIPHLRSSPSPPSWMPTLSMADDVERRAAWRQIPRRRVYFTRTFIHRSLVYFVTRAVRVKAISPSIRIGIVQGSHRCVFCCWDWSGLSTRAEGRGRRIQIWRMQRSRCRVKRDAPPVGADHCCPMLRLVLVKLSRVNS